MFGDCCRFDRKTPVKYKPAGKPGKEPPSHGKTGTSLVKEIRKRLLESLQKDDSCAAVFIVDDLDCRPPENARQSLRRVVNDCLDTGCTPVCIGFAAPELEAWLIADWENTLQSHPDFRSRASRMNYLLSSQFAVPMHAPESFGKLDEKSGSCRHKLSDDLIEASVRAAQSPAAAEFNKARHTPEMLRKIDAQRVAEKCPLFREMWNSLADLCREN
ncbi:MAG: DUF4276 family protein [Desulfobacteraceae bacterium]|nr:DUF4276 family protein [Desulfobacteraceae bacterium]